MSDTPFPPGAVYCASGLVYEVLRRGDGQARPGPEDEVEVRMSGEKGTGEESRTLRVDEVAPGLAEALQLMTVGGRIRAWIPAHLADGEPETREIELLALTRTRDYPTLPIELTSPRDPDEG